LDALFDCVGWIDIWTIVANAALTLLSDCARAEKTSSPKNTGEQDSTHPNVLSFAAKDVPSGNAGDNVVYVLAQDGAFHN
jgi:hypothetical protein